MVINGLCVTGDVSNGSGQDPPPTGARKQRRTKKAEKEEKEKVTASNPPPPAPSKKKVPEKPGLCVTMVYEGAVGWR